jgi:hypothetical protein
MSNGKAKKEHVGGEDEKKSDHGWDPVGRFVQEVEKLRISTPPRTGRSRYHGVITRADPAAQTRRIDGTDQSL